MKTTTAAVSLMALAGSAMAAPTQKQTSFEGLALRSASPIHFASINAHSGTFWLNYPTAVSCPSNVECSNTTATLFTNGQNTLSLNVQVPGGQQVYVDETGAVKYTQPHSAAYLGTETGFSLDKEGSLQYLKFEGKDFLACPTDADSYLVYVDGASAVAEDKDCLGFTFLVDDSSLPAAWEYA